MIVVSEMMKDAGILHIHSTGGGGRLHKLPYFDTLSVISTYHPTIIMNMIHEQLSIIVDYHTELAATLLLSVGLPEHRQ